jgi:hypothetical protein
MLKSVFGRFFVFGAIHHDHKKNFTALKARDGR